MPNGGTYCSVAICKNNARKAKKSGEKLLFFRFPKDTTVRKEWIHTSTGTDNGNINNKRICSIHFKKEDFEDELQARLLNLQPRKLKKTGTYPLSLLSTST